MAGLSLPDLLRARARASSAGQTAKDTAVIQLWLGGGPSQFETYDPKPHSPKEIRGPWKAIDTNLPGVQFCELMPRQAQMADKLAIVRSVHHERSDHGGGIVVCSTGKRMGVEPSTGSIVAKMRGPNALGMPAYAHVGFRPTANLTFGASFKANYLGASYDPFYIEGDPTSDDFEVPNLELAGGVSLDRLGDRKSLLAQFDRLRRVADRSGMFDSMDHFQQAAFEMVTGPRAREAFDLSREDPRLRDRYGVTRTDFVPAAAPKVRVAEGRHRWGQSLLLARRLVEAGVTFVTVNTDPQSFTWDIHGAGAGTVTDTMQLAGEQLDMMLAALVEDLYQRGLEKKVLVLVWGEFGRTPQVNERVGRDHWPAVFSVLLAGGGLKVGQVIGASDSKGALPKDRPLQPEDVLATMYRHLGIDPQSTFVNHAGRPVPILPFGEVIRELI